MGMRELEMTLRGLEDAGLEEVEFASPRGSLIFRASAAEGPAEEAEESSEKDAGSDGVNVTVLRSPVAGVMGAARIGEGDEVPEEGARLGEVVTLMGVKPLRAPARGRLLRWLAREGLVVGYGDPLALLEVL